MSVTVTEFEYNDDGRIVKETVTVSEDKPLEPTYPLPSTTIHPWWLYPPTPYTVTC